MSLRLVMLAAAVVSGAALIAPSTGSAAVRQVEATFFEEFASDTFTVDQGDLVTFVNHDPFLSHSVVADLEQGGEPVFEAPVIGWNQMRLLYRAPFLTTGTYPFSDPAYPGMTSRLVVTSNGSPLPADSTPPTAGVKVRTAALSTLTRRRRLSLTVNPIEPVDVAIVARGAGVLLGRAHRTYPVPGLRSIILKISRTRARGLANRAADLRANGKRTLRVTVSASLTDVAENPGSGLGFRRLPVPAPRKPRAGK
jgi:plastocyanin